MPDLLSATRFLHQTALVFLGIAVSVTCGCSSVERTGNAQPMGLPSPTQSASGNLPTDDVLELATLYKSQNCVGFFKAFPSSFAQFDQLYGFDDNAGPRSFYSQYETHITYFLECSGVPARQRLEKVIGIGIDGRWEADASALLQDGIYKLVRGHPNESKEILDALPDAKASSFWHFLFDGPHPDDKATATAASKMSNALGEGSKQAKLLMIVYRNLRNERRVH